MTQEALKLALEALERTQNEGYNLPGIAIREAITAIKEALAEHAMRETQRLGQEIEQEPVRLQCVTCGTVYADGVPPQVTQPEQEPVAWAHYDTFKNLGSLTRARFTATLATKNTCACCIALYTHPINQKEFK